jgi:hypothetical protein
MLDAWARWQLVKLQVGISLMGVALAVFGFREGSLPMIAGGIVVAVGNAVWGIGRATSFL